MTKRGIFRPSSKSKLAYRLSTRCRFLILEGAVRSSKSYTLNDAFLDRVQTLPDCNILVSGHSSSAVSRNVIAEWKKAIGSDRFKTVKTDKDEYLLIDFKGLKGKKFYLRGAAKANDFEQIQGSTFGAWYPDEITRHHESFWDMALTRLSLDYSFGMGSLNPDNPYHWFKERFLDKEELYTEDENGYSQYKKVHFVLDDNPSLSDEYKESLKSSFSGVFYDRYILGKWVKAEGLVYPHFDPNRHIIPYEKIPNKMDELRVALDYGTQNACTFGFYGRIGKDWIKINEYYHSGRDSGKQKTNAQYKDDLITFFKENNIPLTTKVIVDPSAAGFKADLRQRRNQSDIEFKVNNASNKVAKGIQYLSTLIGNDNYYISDRCIETKKEYATYSWDAKKQKDEPIKENDHCMDADRYAVYTVFGSMK